MNSMTEDDVVSVVTGAMVGITLISEGMPIRLDDARHFVLPCALDHPSCIGVVRSFTCRGNPGLVLATLTTVPNSSVVTNRVTVLREQVVGEIVCDDEFDH